MSKAIDKIDVTIATCLERAKTASSSEREALILYSGLVPGILHFEDLCVDMKMDAQLYLQAFLLATVSMAAHALLNASEGKREIALESVDDFVEYFEDALIDQIKESEMVAKFGKLDS